MILGMLLWFTVSFGLQDFTDAHEYVVIAHAPIFAEIELHAENDWLDIYGIYFNEMKPDEFIYFQPTQDYFTIGAEISIGSFAITAEHMCQHPIMADWIKDYDVEWGGYNRVYISLSSK